jgi:hypothetical protein
MKEKSVTRRPIETNNVVIVTLGRIGIQIRLELDLHVVMLKNQNIINLLQEQVCKS